MLFASIFAISNKENCAINSPGKQKKTIIRNWKTFRKTMRGEEKVKINRGKKPLFDRCLISGGNAYSFLKRKVIF
ncbi:unnamed protein product [Meloidogyne enterolobii]|uniref:Uncharacterized protein n=1 Tax=Meloidogyne enterolobii TaxID=390850 RepID=A0ACB0XMI7_MELEN